MGGCLGRSFQVGDAVELGPEGSSPKVTKALLAEMGKLRGESGLLGRGSALSRLGAELELRRSGSSLGPSQ